MISDRNINRLTFAFPLFHFHSFCFAFCVVYDKRVRPSGKLSRDLILSVTTDKVYPDIIVSLIVNNKRKL
jgi:hypothetical protein